MAIEVSERFARLELAEDGATRVYLVTGTSSESDALAALKLVAPTTYGNLVRDTPAVSVREMRASETWEGNVPYIERGGERQEVDQSSFAFSIGGGTRHITNSYETERSYGANAPDFKGAIGVEGVGAEMTVKGTDILVPEYTERETKTFADTDVTDAFKGDLFAVVGRMNDAEFKGLDAGEALLLGVEGSTRDDGDWDITFEWSGSPNTAAADNVMVGDLGPIVKRGWDHLWVVYDTEVDQNRLVQRPVFAYVERVYAFGDFSLLRLD